MLGIFPLAALLVVFLIAWKFSRGAEILTGIYLALVLASVGIIIYSIHADPGNSELCGVPALILTLPWSMLVLTLFGKSLPDSMVVTSVVIGGSALFNAALLYGLAKLIQRFRRLRS
jgi:hypothetical protein